MDKFRNINAFIAVVENGSFAEAARKMGLSRAQVNNYVIALEDELGVQLLQRTTRKVSVTRQGEEYYDRVITIISDLHEADSVISEKQDNPSGTLKINAPHIFGVLELGPTLLEFMDRYPDIDLDVHLSDRFIDPLEEGFDATIRIDRQNDNASLIDHPICDVKLHVVASPDFVKQHGAVTSPDQLKTLPCLLHDGTINRGNYWHFERSGKAMKVKVSGPICANSGEFLRDAAIKGKGITQLPDFIIADALADGKLVKVLTDYKLPKLELMMIYPPHRHISLRLKKLIDFMYEKFT